jgi:hypothetical protein
MLLFKYLYPVINFFINDFFKPFHYLRKFLIICIFVEKLIIKIFYSLSADIQFKYSKYDNFH